MFIVHTCSYMFIFYILQCNLCLSKTLQSILEKVIRTHSTHITYKGNIFEFIYLLQFVSQGGLPHSSDRYKLEIIKINYQIAFNNYSLWVKVKAQYGAGRPQSDSNLLRRQAANNSQCVQGIQVGVEFNIKLLAKAQPTNVTHRVKFWYIRLQTLPGNCRASNGVQQCVILYLVFNGQGDHIYLAVMTQKYNAIHHIYAGFWYCYVRRRKQVKPNSFVQILLRCYLTHLNNEEYLIFTPTAKLV